MHGKRVGFAAVVTLWRTNELELGGRKMRKIASVLVIALAFSTTAGAADIAFYVGAPNVDGWYDVATELKDVETIIAQSGHLFKDVQKFDDSQFKAFGAWVDENTNDGEMDIIWLNGCVPSVLYQFPNVNPDGSRAEKWLDGGNMIINVGDWFGYCSYEGGPRQADNGGTGAANILDLSSGIIVSADNTSMKVTPAGKEYLPSLKDTMITYRPIVLAEVRAPWEVAAIFASLGGTDAATETRADPVVIHNTVTDAYVAFINQCAGGTSVWIDRGQATVEFINNWVTDKIGLGPMPLARGPNPKNGSMVEKTFAQASWRAGDFAALHDVYFGESAEEVDAATPDNTAVYLGRQAITQLPMGMANGPASSGLVPGKTYYWRIDEINDANPDSPWKGKVWSFTVRPLAAWKPYPTDGMKYVDPEQDLSWEKGMGVLFHMIYFGDNFEQVSSIPAGGWMSVTAAYDPGHLELDKTYYWRVDEFTGPVTHKGPVWSFITRGSGGGVKAQYFNGMALAGDPILTQTEGSIDHNWGSADVTPGVADLVSARWTANLQVPFTESYRLITSTDDGVQLWFDGHQVISGWVDQGTTDYSATVNLIAGQIYHIRMEYYENGGGAVAQLSWESASLPRQIIPQGWLQLPLWATGPSPANAELHAVQDGVLRWIPGDEATNHDVYFGDSAEAVANADTTAADIYKGRQAAGETSFDAGGLEWNKTYYWRVDEINESNPASPWKGAVWSFTTADFLIVEDFESYTDDEGSEIFSTWIDGWADSSSGSRVGYLNPPYAEHTIVHSGWQSMPLDYNNVNAPYYSEATRTWDTPQNWTVNGVDTLTLYFRGASGNGAEKLYVALQDSAGKTAVVVNPNADAATAKQWTEWKVPLSSFAGVNAAKIKKMVIGLGDQASPKQGGAGIIYVDDIRVTKP